MSRVRVLGTTATIALGLVAGWKLFTRMQGDSDIVVDDASFASEPDVAHVVRGSIAFSNRGRQTGVLRRVAVTVLGEPDATVTVERRGSRPHQPGWWVANLVHPGETTVADIEICFPQDPGPTVLEVDIEEIGRGLLRHRSSRHVVSSADGNPAIPRQALASHGGDSTPLPHHAMKEPTARTDTPK
jgi:hypothetical protein